MTFYDSDNYHPERSIGYLARVVAQASQAGLETVLAAEGLSPTQWHVLVLTHYNATATCAVLARDLAHDKGAMTRVVDTLEERGWLTRERIPGDRRAVRIALTDAGRAVAMRARDRVLACWNAWLDGWPADEVETLIAMLRRLRAAVETDPEPCA